MTRRLGEVRGRAATMVAALLLIATLLPGTNWTLAPLDPAFASGGYALISVGRGAAGAVADEARALGADDVASLDSIDVVSARVTSSALDSLRRDARVAFIASDAIVTAASDEKHYERPQGKPSVGNEAIVASGAALGARGTVIGKSGRFAEHVIVHFAPDVLERLAIQDKILIRALGRRCSVSGMRDAPTAEALASQAPALLASFDLSGSRAIALVRAAREVASSVLGSVRARLTSLSKSA